MRGFLLILVAGIGCAVLGAVIGWLMGCLSPEFVALVAQPNPVADPPRLGAAFGLISGLLLGAGAMAFGLFVEALRVWALRNRAVRGAPSSPSSESTDFSIRSV